MGKGYSQTRISPTSITKRARTHTHTHNILSGLGGGGGGCPTPKNRPPYVPGYDYRIMIFTQDDIRTSLEQHHRPEVVLLLCDVTTLF